MHLLSCENPQRIFNKYIGEYVWVPCGKCNTCRNAKSARWTDALERERLAHRFCFFITLTYDDFNLPICNHGTFDSLKLDIPTFERKKVSLVPRSQYDSFCIPFKVKDLFLDKSESDLFFGFYRHFGGIPYASFSDIQYFNKRLNKHFHDKITQTFKNFRYFVVSEYGTTTFRPHFHGIYFVDDKRVADDFANAISLCWSKGRTDSKYVESSATSYCAQYVNKHSHLPLFYQTRELRPRFVFSKFPSIGSYFNGDSSSVGTQYSDGLQEVFDSGTVEICARGKKDTSKFMVVPLGESLENSLYPKLTQFKSISDSLRTELYQCCCRFARKGREGFQGFLKDVLYYLHGVYADEKSAFYDPLKAIPTEFSEYLYRFFYKRYMSLDDNECRAGFNWLRRLYYISRKVCLNACNFKVSLSTYVDKIVQYYNKKELYILRKFYTFQETYSGCVEDLSLMYPEYLYVNGFIVPRFYVDARKEIDGYEIEDVRLQRETSAFYAMSNKLTHFKNAYLDSLELKRNMFNFYSILKTYFYAKKCHEVVEAFAT